MQVPGDIWIRSNTSSQNVPTEEYTVTGLERDLRYQFRVIAKTAVNMSRPSEPTEAVLVCAENGELVGLKCYFLSLECCVSLNLFVFLK